MTDVPVKVLPSPGETAAGGATAVIDRRDVFAAGAVILALGVAPAARAASGIDDASFLALSVQATGVADLPPATASRLLEAFRSVDAGSAARFESLADVVGGAVGPVAALDAARSAGLDGPLRALIAAWYTGTVGEGPAGVVVTFVDALMYRAIVDAAPVQTYCGNGPLWWTGDPPPLGIPVLPPDAPEGGPAVPLPAGKGAPAKAPSQ